MDADKEVAREKKTTKPRRDEGSHEAENAKLRFGKSAHGGLALPRLRTKSGIDPPLGAIGNPALIFRSYYERAGGVVREKLWKKSGVVVRDADASGRG